MVPGALTSRAPGLIVQGRPGKSPQVELQVSTVGTVGSSKFMGAKRERVMHWPGLLPQGARQPSVGSRGIEEPLKKPFIKNW